MKHEGRREGVSPAFHGLSRERKGNDRGVVIPLCRLPRQGRSGPFLTALLELLTALFELLTALLELLTARQSCSERVVIIRIVRVDGSAGPAGPL